MYGKFVVDRKDPVKGNTEQELKHNWDKPPESLTGIYLPWW